MYTHVTWHVTVSRAHVTQHLTIHETWDKGSKHVICSLQVTREEEKTEYAASLSLRSYQNMRAKSGRWQLSRNPGWIMTCWWGEMMKIFLWLMTQTRGETPLIPGPGMFIVIFQGGSRQPNVLMRCNECIPICRQIAQAPGASDSSPALSLSLESAA